MSELRKSSCTEFTELLASPLPAPGGGGASALVAALAVSLGDMVGELTVGKPKYAAQEDDLRSLMERSQTMRVRLLQLIDEDGEQFLPLAAAYRIPKEDPSRDEVMEQALRDAVQAPLEIFNLSCEAIDLLRQFGEKGSRLMQSDVGTGIVLAWSAMYGAAMNVKVNTKMMKDREFADRINTHLDTCMDRSYRIAEEVYDRIYRSLS